MRQGGRQKRLAGKLRFASFLPSGLARCCLSQESETWFRLCGAPISAGFANVSTTARASTSGRRSPLWDKKREQQEIGRAHVRTPVTNAHLVCRLLLENKKHPHTV